MKKVFYLILCILLMGLSACQPTPGQAAVADKNGELEKLIMQPAVSYNPMLDSLPDRWKEETEFKSGVTLVIDAEIKVPDVKSYPVTEATPHAFTPEEAKTYVDIFMQGQPVYEIRPSRIKSDWEAEILQVQADIESTKNNESLPEDMRQQTVSELNQQLEFLEGKYNEAPEKKPDPVPADMTFVRQSDTMQVLGVEADLGQKSPAILDIHITDDNLGNGILFYNGSKDDYSAEIYAVTVAGTALTRQEAQQKGEEYLKGLGITDMQLAYTEILADPGDFAGSDYSVLAEDSNVKKCYVFSYCPVVSGIPATINRFYYGNTDSTKEYDKVWHDETILVYVNDSGVYRMDWYGPDDLGQVLNENAALLDCEEIKAIFEKQMFYQRTWSIPGAEGITITIKEVKLGMMRVRLQENKYVYLPVWDFIGDWACISDGVKIYNQSFLTLNAIDGSVIDRGVGY